jgi:hypothetical protein
MGGRHPTHARSLPVTVCGDGGDAGDARDLMPSHARDLIPSHARDLMPSHARDLIRSHARDFMPSHARDLIPSHARDLIPSHARYASSASARPGPRRAVAAGLSSLPAAVKPGARQQPSRTRRRPGDLRPLTHQTPAMPAGPAAETQTRARPPPQRVNPLARGAEGHSRTRDPEGLRPSA